MRPDLFDINLRHSQSGTLNATSQNNGPIKAATINMPNVCQSIQKGYHKMTQNKQGADHAG